MAGVAFRAADGDLRAIGQRSRRVAAANHRRDAQFACDDRRVTRASAAIGDDRARALHHRLPVRIGDLGDEHIAVGHALHLRRRLDEPHRSLADLLSDRTSRREWLRVSLQPIAAQRIAVFARLHGLRPRLQDVDAPVGAVECPFDVHRAPVMLLDGHGVTRELFGLCVGQRKLHPLRIRHVDNACRLVGTGRVGEDHPRRLAADALAQDRRTPRGKVRLVDAEFVRIHRALHNGLAESVRRCDQHDAVEARFGVQREHDAGGAGIAAHHPLDADRQRNLVMRKAVMNAVRDGPIVVDRCEHPRNHF